MYICIYISLNTKKRYVEIYIIKYQYNLGLWIEEKSTSLEVTNRRTVMDENGKKCIIRIEYEQNYPCENFIAVKHSHISEMFLHTVIRGLPKSLQ